MLFHLINKDDYEELCMKNDGARPQLSKTRRNQLLLVSDWSILPDNGLSESKRQEWLEYRQALRDLTEQSGFPENIVWPTPPSKD